MDLLDYIFGATTVFYSLVAPFTKVEESFNLQAVHDILKFGVGHEALPLYDHFEFPGVLPRTFIGALGLSALSWPLTTAIKWVFDESIAGSLSQIAVRATLGLINVFALVMFRHAADRVYGKHVGRWYLILQVTQFHLVFYATRTLPNVFALPFTSLAATYFITPNASLTPALVLLTISALIFRAEIVLLLATHVAYHFLITKRLRFWTTLRVGIRASFAGLAMTSIVDTYFWQTPLAPELHSVVFNVIEGKAKAWGTSPFYAYGFDLLKLLLNPLAPFLIGLAVYVDSNVLHFLIPALSFVGLYSFQAHKEWRFIIYVVPQLTLAAAIGANYIFHRRAKSLLWRLAALAVVASVPATALISGTMLFISSYNYPGGQALAQLPLNSTGPVYLDVLTCMTGASRFLQSGPRKFSKTEDMRLLQSTPFWQSLEFAILQDPSTLQSRPGWTEYERIPGLQMRELKHLKWKKEDKLYIYRNTLFNITDRAEQSEQ